MRLSDAIHKEHDDDSLLIHVAVSVTAQLSQEYAIRVRGFTVV